MSKLGGNIKRFRIGKGWSQKDLAEMMGKTESAVSNWERGKNKMDTDGINSVPITSPTTNARILFSVISNTSYQEVPYHTEMVECCRSSNTV